MRMFVKKDVVEEVDNPCTEMSLEEARPLPQAQLGDVLRIEIKPRNFGRIAAQTARQVIIQGMREGPERGMIYDEFNSKEHEILTGLVTRIDPRSGAASLRIGSGNESTEAYLAVSEQVKGRAPHRGHAPARLCGGSAPLHQGTPGPPLPHPSRSGQAPL